VSHSFCAAKIGLLLGQEQYEGPRATEGIQVETFRLPQFSTRHARLAGFTELPQELALLGAYAPQTFLLDAVDLHRLVLDQGAIATETCASHQRHVGSSIGRIEPCPVRHAVVEG
jgi:hypothetical protein